MQKIKYFTPSYFSVPKDVRLNSTHYLIMKINNRRELQNIAINHFWDIDYKDFMEIYRQCTRERFSFLTIDTTLPASNPLRVRKKAKDAKDLMIEVEDTEDDLDKEKLIFVGKNREKFNFSTFKSPLDFFFKYVSS